MTISHVVSDNAACKGEPKSTFYPEYSTMGPSHIADAHAHALSFCDACPVRSECLEEELHLTSTIGAGRSYGVRGGLTAKDRDVELRRRRTTGAIPRFVHSINHGTYAGATAHRRRGEPVCELCAAAFRTYQAQRSERRRAEASA